MNIVVESRKKFGKMCVDYEKKCSHIEIKMLNIQLETLSNYKFKPKHSLPTFDSEGFEYLEKCISEMTARRRRVDEMRQKIQNAQAVMNQMKTDEVGQRLVVPLTIDNLINKT